MKRNENIIPLSRDHHFGLLFCWKIRQGIKLGVDTERIKPYVLYYWHQHLRQHFHEEETLLFLVDEDAYCRRALEEHRHIEQLVKDIERSSADIDLLLSLADLVDQHIRYEERELFPHLEQILTEAQLNTIGVELQRLHIDKTTDNYNDGFWVKIKA